MSTIQDEILIIGMTALVVWGFIWYQSCKGPLRWATPTSLFAMGNILLYIFPSLYWQFRPWNFPYPPYFDGLPLVLGGFLILALPFMLYAVARVGHKKAGRIKIQFPGLKSGSLPWIFIFIILIGIGWRIYLFSLGHQARLARENPKIMGSESLALMIENFSYYYPICYFALFALSKFGDKIWRRIGISFWVIDGLLQLYALHRQLIIIFVLRSIIFWSIIGLKFRLRHWAVVSIVMVFVVSFIGSSHRFASDLSNERLEIYLTVPEVVTVMKTTGISYFTEAIQGEAVINILLQALDETMGRAYEARSASAVMMGVPDVIPYFNGGTFVQVLYSVIPRYFWEGKPDLTNIQAVTTLVMPDDSGVNPAGSLAELYMNFGFTAILLGGFFSLFICRLTDNLLARKDIGLPIICAYPVIAELFLAANMSFTRRLSEGVRGMIVLWLVTLLFKFCRQTQHAKIILPLSSGEHEVVRRL